MMISEPTYRSNFGLFRAVRQSALILFRSRRILFRWCVVGAAVGIGICMVMAEEFTASTKILPYKNASPSSSLSGLAGLAGIRLPAGMSDQTITGDLYPVIASTLDFKIGIANTPLYFARDVKTNSFLEYFTLHRSAFARLRSALIPQSEGALSTQESKAPTDKAWTSPAIPHIRQSNLDILERLDDRLLVRIDKKTAVITLVGIMPDPYAAADLVRVASDLLMKRIIEYEAKKATEQLGLVQRQYNQNKIRFERAQEILANFSDRNRVLISSVSQIERERLQQEYDIALQVYKQLSVELEQARIKKSQDTPVFTVIESVTVPNRRSSPHRTRIVLTSAFFGAMLGIATVLWSKRPSGEM
jgi:hypothetical protein